MNFFTRTSRAFFTLALCGSMASSTCGCAWAQNTDANEGGDIAFGGPGLETGKFLELRDITLDARGNLYALDGARLDSKTKERAGNIRVQKFDATGKFLSASSLADPSIKDQDPQRLAALADGTVFVTQAEAEMVQVLGPDGKLRRTLPLPNALAITAYKNSVAVVPSRRAIVNGKWAWLGGDKIVLMNSAGDTEREITLEKTLENVQDVTSDRAGNFYIQAEPNAIYKISPEGKILRTFGGNPTTRNPDGSEVLHTVAVDSKDNVYTMAWGNPGHVLRFDADGQTVASREGQFKWADPWSIHSEYTPLAIGPDDRLWVGATHRFAPDYVHMKTQRAAPAIVRTATTFFEETGKSTKTPTRMLGFRANVASGLPYSIAYETGKPIPMSISVAPARRAVQSVTARWQALDAFKKPVASGETNLPLTDGAEAKASFTWVPPRFGAYSVRVAFESQSQPMGAHLTHVGVTPRFANMKVLAEGESNGGWADSPRQAWSGLSLLRIHPARADKPEDWKKTDEEIALAEKNGVTYLLQLVDNLKDLSPEQVRRVATRYKGRAKYYEVCNEPNFGNSIEKYFEAHKMAYGILKEVDPQAVVMGPGTVNIDLNWMKKLYELGFKNVTDAISLHDYEGHESISPEHWKYKFGAVRAIMKANGDEAKPIWQTERAISGVRGNNFQGLAQAIRTTLHRDLLEELGIPSEHNSHYYLNQGGYSSVPTYVWSNTGPHPAALALRTRHAMTSALGRKYLGTTDFGATGNTFLMGTRYRGATGETVVLRNEGTRPFPLQFSVRGGAGSAASTLDVVDAWGNAIATPIAGGRARLVLEQMPIYVRLKPGQSMAPAPLDMGRNVSALANWTYAGVTKSDFKLLSNGILETYHDANPDGGTNGEKIWTGDIAVDAAGQQSPQVLEATFAQPQRISGAIVRGVRGDNQFCTLQEYDLEYFDGTNWKVLEAVRNPLPATEEAMSADATHAIWMDDTNLYVHRFAPVTAQKLRLTARRTSFGFVPDNRSRAWGNQIPPKLMLREIEVFAAPTTVAQR